MVPVAATTPETTPETAPETASETAPVRRRPQFHPLTVAKVEKLTDDAVAVTRRRRPVTGPACTMGE